jgi:hypothetical protein
MFYITGMSDGLSNAETVLNMQRHITEYGPIWVAFMVTSAFEDNDWKSNPVYTGGGSNSGGHVVNAIGWGAHGQVDYWLIRNSWAASWADDGYCKFQRGVNLDGIESRGLGASMPAANFPDFSPPSCSVTKWTYTYWTQGCCTLTKYLTTLTILCNKKASLKTFVSNRITNHAQIQSGVSGQYYDGTAEANTPLTMSPIEMLPFGFGLQTGDSWIQIAATDVSGNTAKSSNFVTLNAISGMTDTA